MRTVILYGELAERFGKYHRFSVKTAGEAIRALKANFKGFEAYMTNAHLQSIGFKIFVGGHSLAGYPEVYQPSGKNEVIRIVPVIAGSGGSPWIRILIGAVLVVGGIIVTGLSFGAAGPLGAAMISAGAALIIGGVSQLLTKPPEIQGQSQADLKSSYIFNGGENTTVQGSPVPLGYGRMIVGSVVISAGVETNEV